MKLTSRQKLIAILIVFCAISLFFLLQINIGIIPLFKSDIPAARTEKINGLVSDLSQGMLISTLFYFLLVYIPEKQKADRIKALINPKLGIITENMERSILYFMLRAKCQEMDILNLPKNAFNSISGLTGSVMDFRYQVMYKDGDWTPFSTGMDTDIDYFRGINQSITQNINEILALPHIVDEDEDIIDILPRIRESHFIKCPEWYFKFRLAGQSIITPEFPSYIQDYYNYFVKLKKLNVGKKVRITPDGTEGTK